MSDQAWIDSAVESWATDTESYFSVRGLSDPELAIALREAVEAIRQVLAVTRGAPGAEIDVSAATERPE